MQIKTRIGMVDSDQYASEDEMIAALVNRTGGKVISSMDGEVVYAETLKLAAELALTAIGEDVKRIKFFNWDYETETWSAYK